MTALEQLELLSFRSMPPERKAGLEVPLDPVIEPQRFCSWNAWTGTILSGSAFESARKEGVFDAKPIGPRGGMYYAIKNAKTWRAWARLYRSRVEAIEARKAARRLGYTGRVPKR